MAYKYEIKTHGDPKFYQNGVVFATDVEAMSAGHDKLSAWSMAVDVRVVPSDDAPNYAYIDGKVQALEAA